MKKKDDRTKEILRLQGKELRKYRKASGLGQKEVSLMVGRSMNWLSEIENGRNSIDAIDLCKLCTIYNVDPNILFRMLIAEIMK